MKRIPLILLTLFLCVKAQAQLTIYPNDAASNIAATALVDGDNILIVDENGNIALAGVGRADALAVTTTAHGNCGATEAFSALTGFHTATLDANLTLTLGNFSNTGMHSTITVRFTQDATGGRTITCPAEVVAAPIINPVASSVTTVTFETSDGGVTVYAHSDFATEMYEFALSDETTVITTGTAKLTWRTPYAFHVTSVRSSLTTVSSSGLPTVDINEAGTTILSTKLTIDANENTSTTAAAAYVISDANLADDALMTFDIDVAGTDAAGLKVKIYGYRQ